MSGVSYEQLMKPIQIMKVVRRLHQVGAFFTNFMNMGPGRAPDIITTTRTFGYDIYASTRTVAPITAPFAPPAQMGLKPIGQNTATLVRSHGAIPILDEKIFGSRRVGGPLSSVDRTGQSYYRLQLEHLVTSFRNSREFMISRMLRGGFGLKQSFGDQYRLQERSASDNSITVSYGIDGENFADLGGIIGAGEGWDQTSAPIHEHFMELDKRMARKTGYSPRHCILNSSTMAPIFQNTVLQKIRGDAFRIFDTFTKKEISPGDARSSAYYTVVFGALPHINFHVLNEGLVLNEVVPNETEQISTANFELFVPDGKVMILPEPDRIWAGTAGGVEPIRERVDQTTPREVQGFGIWRTPTIDPSGFSVKALDNFIPLLYIPNVVHFADVWSPFTSSES
jgi:hypothetical protein